MRTRSVTQLQRSHIIVIGIFLPSIQTEILAQDASQGIECHYAFVLHCTRRLVVLIIKACLEGELVGPVLIILQTRAQDILLILICDRTDRNGHNHIISSDESYLLPRFLYIVHGGKGYIVAQRFVLVVFLFVEGPHNLRLSLGAQVMRTKRHVPGEEKLLVYIGRRGTTQTQTYPFQFIPGDEV